MDLSKAELGHGGEGVDSRPLKKFVAWFLSESPKFGMIPTSGAVSYIGDVTAALWYRQGQFQVQQFIVPPSYIIPAHAHPNVDSYELYLGGEMQFSLGKEFAFSREDSAAVTGFGTALMRGTLTHVRPHDLHGGRFGPNGGVFMSIQHWLNGVKPHCVSADYSGLVMSDEHYRSVKYGAPIKASQETLSPGDALGGD